MKFIVSIHTPVQGVTANFNYPINSDLNHLLARKPLLNLLKHAKRLQKELKRLYKAKREPAAKIMITTLSQLNK